ncbi:cation:proton antiporter domain-containing protein [Salinimicrobium xinjiangense]|uniref:cation:proton antiporter domain-containing protein n=1 Tax=Salinimicrobium xinjiangense TaxID=438596 RepID=UPI00041D0606|nr:cation:proton antiporter [Salinimicrobium xinjiangense]
MDLMLIIFFISLLIILSGAFYKKIQNISITEPFLALALGVLVGPDVLNVIESTDSESEFKVLELACQFTIAMALMATALRLPKHIFRKNATSLTNLVIFGMIFMWGLSSGIIYLLLPDFSVFECLLIGAIITPTDPVVASTLVTGEKAEKYLPENIRNTLSFEAGANDGFAYPIVFLALYLLGAEGGGDLGQWFTKVLLYENILCAILAYGVGYGCGFLMKKAHKAGFLNTKTLLSFSIAVALLLLGGFHILEMNPIIAVFVGGFAFAKDITANEDIEEERIQETMERLTTVPVFFILGLMLPWQDWYSMGWTAVWIVILILLFRRLPALLLLMPVMPKFRKKIYSVLIMGWFGPIGVAALYYAVISKDKAHFEDAWIIPSLIVAASTVVHGLTSVPLEKLYHDSTEGTNERENLDSRT